MTDPPSTEPLRSSDFDQDFTWGVATAAYQIQGVWDVDDTGPSISDTFTRRPTRLGPQTGADRSPADD